MKIVYEIIAIVFASIIIALAYNFTLPKPLPLIREKVEPAKIDDNILFGNNLNQLSPMATDSIIKNGETVTKTDKPKTDSLIVSKNEEITAKTDKKEIIEAHSNLEKSVTYEQLLKIINNPDFIIIDARNPDNYAKDRIGNAINIFPYGDELKMMNAIFSLPADKKLLVYCDGGNCDASHKLAELLIALGYKKVFIYTGGWEEWTLKRSKNQ